MNTKKLIAAVAAGALALGCTIGGTVAWLTAKTNTITNVFTTSDVTVTLTESEGLDLQMVPGHTIAKDPKASVSADSEDCFLFVQITESENFDDFMTYEIADGWTALDDVAGVYYKEYDTGVTDNVKGTAYSILKNDQVVVLEGVTKAQMNAFDTDKDGELSNTEKAALPTLSFTAYAVQLDKNATESFSADDAWEQRPTA